MLQKPQGEAEGEVEVRYLMPVPRFPPSTNYLAPFTERNPAVGTEHKSLAASHYENSSWSGGWRENLVYSLNAVH